MAHVRIIIDSWSASIPGDLVGVDRLELILNDKVEKSVRNNKFTYLVSSEGIKNTKFGFLVYMNKFKLGEMLIWVIFSCLDCSNLLLSTMLFLIAFWLS